jgi:hypothetical protein
MQSIKMAHYQKWDDEESMFARSLFASKPLFSKRGSFCTRTIFSPKIRFAPENIRCQSCSKIHTLDFSCLCPISKKTRFAHFYLCETFACLEMYFSKTSSLLPINILFSKQYEAEYDHVCCSPGYKTQISSPTSFSNHKTSHSFAYL